MRRPLLSTVLILINILSRAQNPYHHFSEAMDIRYSSKQPVIHYTIVVDTADLSTVSVEMKITNIPDTFHLGMYVHPEYDDRFYRFVENLTVTGDEGAAKIERLENTLWKVHSKGGTVFIRYRIHLPAERRPRAAWRPFLSSSGGLIGGPHYFFFVVGQTLAPSYVHLQLPSNWKVATGLHQTIDPMSFFAATAGELFDNPILVGNQKRWTFSINGVPHQVVYWPSNNYHAFDTTLLVSGIQKLVEQAALVFGRLPYRDYSFLLQDESYGALEHANSVTLGTPSDQLATEMDEYLSEIAHEYFHCWNIMRIRPAEYGDVSYKPGPLSKGLWWSEGLTMFYADLLLRRAGLIATSRTQHLEHLIENYFSQAGNYKLSAEKASMASYALPGYAGDYDGNPHLVGELMGNIFDLIIRDRTNGKRSVDDAMRKMMERFSGTKGFTNNDIEALLRELSGKNFHSFFEQHIRGNQPIDFNPFLSLAGLTCSIKMTEARSENGDLLPDLNVYAYQLPDQKEIRIGIRDPLSCWGRSGLHTGDQLLSVNDSVITTPSDFFVMIRKLKVGDELKIKIMTGEKSVDKNVKITGYKWASVKIGMLPQRSKKQKEIFEQWSKSN
jgi:predicted metalloprotease with PDZ domain